MDQPHSNFISNLSLPSLKQAIMLKIASKKERRNDKAQQAELKSSAVYSSAQASVLQLQLLQFILSLQLQQHSGYLGFKQWIEINNFFWGDSIINVAEQLWKIIRLINEGQVIIPTGLVYEVVKCLLSNPKEQNIKLILQSFLKKNKRKPALNSYRQIKNYLTLHQIVIGYTPSMKNDNVKELKEQKNTINFGVNRLSQNQKHKQLRLNHLRYQSLMEQMKNCPFKPEITQFASQAGRDKTGSKQMHFKCFFNQDKGQQVVKAFKAKSISEKIYQKSLKSIPGVAKHIQRKLYSQQERLRLQRFKEKPVGNYE